MAADINTDNNSQNRPILETVPVEEAEVEDTISTGSSPPPKFVPEEIPDEIAEETPEELTLKDIGGGSSGGGEEIPTIDESSFGTGGPMRKYIYIGMAVFGVVALFVIVLTVILSLTGGKKDAVALEYWGLWEDEQVMKPLIDDYTKKNPHVTIRYTKQDPKSYREKLVARSKEGRGPDIFRFHNTWLPSIIEIAAPIPQSIMSNEMFEKTFYRVIQEDMMSSSSYYGIPLEIDGLVLVYNNDLFKRGGISSAPQTWDDVVRIADTLRVQDAQENILTSGISLGTANNIEHFSDILGWMFLQNGADLNRLQSPEAVEVLTNYRQFAEPQHNLWNETMPNNISAFTQGKVAMIIVPSWQILQIIASNPELDLKVTQLPVLPGSQSISFATYWVEGVSKSSKNQEEAWRFVEFLSQKENMTKMYEEQVKVRPFGTPYSRVDLRDSLLENEYIGPVLEQAPNMKSMPVAWRTYDNGLNDGIIKYLEDAVNATIRGVSYQQALSTAGPGISEVLARYPKQ